MSSYNEYMAAYMKARYKRRRDKAIALLGGKCVACGAEDDLNFHHRDPSTKSLDVGKALAGRRWPRIVEELAKCELRCVACHGDAHAVDNPHGTMRKFWQGCRCRECRQEKNRHHNEWRRQHRAKLRAARVVQRRTAAL